MSIYADAINPYKQWHMRRAFRLGWEAGRIDKPGRSLIAYDH